MPHPLEYLKGCRCRPTALLPDAPPWIIIGPCQWSGGRGGVIIRNPSTGGLVETEWNAIVLLDDPFETNGPPSVPSTPSDTEAFEALRDAVKVPLLQFLSRYGNGLPSIDIVEDLRDDLVTALGLNKHTSTKTIAAALKKVMGADDE